MLQFCTNFILKAKVSNSTAFYRLRKIYEPELVKSNKKKKLIICLHNCFNKHTDIHDEKDAFLRIRLYSMLNQYIQKLNVCNKFNNLVDQNNGTNYLELANNKNAVVGKIQELIYNKFMMKY